MLTLCLFVCPQAGTANGATQAPADNQIAVHLNKRALLPLQKTGPYRCLSDIPYIPGGSRAQMLDLYLPKSLTPMPLVVFIHGGGWYEGDKSSVPPLPLTAHGYAVASINYRLVDEAVWPAQIHDVKAAIRYLRSNASGYNLDPNRIGVWGMSAGAHLAALLGTSGDIPALEGPVGAHSASSRVQAVVDWYGPTDFVSIGNGQGLSSNARGMLERFFGRPMADCKEAACAASPITYTSSDDPPFLLMHGDQDKLVPVSQSQHLNSLLKTAGVKTNLIVVQGAGHRMFDQSCFRQVQSFFDQTLKSRRAAKR